MAFQLPPLNRRIGFHLLVLVGLGVLLIILYRDFGSGVLHISTPAPLDTPSGPTSSTRIPCIGPRGRPVAETDDDQVQAISLEVSYPDPVGGSYSSLGLPLTFNTPQTRYGPYGYHEEDGRPPVQWGTVDWAGLQNECLAQNQDRFYQAMNVSTNTRFHLPIGPPRFKELERRVSPTGRTAIVLRAWEGYNYTLLDSYHLRSLMIEAGLGTGGEYAVFLLVDVKDQNNTRHIFHESQSYDEALRDLVPEEFRSIAVLFDLELLESWYPRIHEHSAFFQVYQPLQMFAQLFPGFDHYWQLEMDMKLTGDSRLWLEAMTRFARGEPRKQSVERSSYYYMPQVHGTYDDFKASINESLGGRGIWGPVRIDDIRHPIGPQPPVADPLLDDFAWGVGEEADLILTNALANVQTTKFWPFKGWVHGFAKMHDTPRFYSPVAMGRYSWNLLNAMHHAQVHQGLALSSEAMAVSFALYHGLKVIFPPHPWFHHPQANREVNVHELEQLFNGGTPAENAQANDGLSFGRAMYNPQGVYKLFNGGTWWWVPGYPGRSFKKWMAQTSEELPGMLRNVDGKIWAPMMALHPVKTGE